MNKKTILEIMIILGSIGLVISLYLLKNHYFPQETGVCQIGEKISCLSLDAGEYSLLFHVPVALFGVIWFTALNLLSWKASNHDGLIVEAILGWSVVGTLFVFYFIALEVILKTLCPFCTVVHIITIITLILSCILYYKKKTLLKENLKEVKN